MNVKSVVRGTKEFYVLLEKGGFDLDKFIVFGGAALVLHGLEKTAADIDILALDKRLFKQLKIYLKPCHATKTFISYERKGVEYQIGLPEEFKIVQPEYKEERIFDNIKIYLRPLHLLYADQKAYKESLEKDFSEVGETPADLKKYYPRYRKILRRLKKLEAVLY
jgi:hypothetical protein